MAVTVFEDDFNRADLNPSDYAGKGNVWSLSGTAYASMGIVDNAFSSVRTVQTGGDAVAIASFSKMADFNTASEGQQILSLNFDFKVNSFSGVGNQTNSVRVGIYTSNYANRLFLAFGAVDIDGTIVNALYLASTTNSAATVNNIIGYNANTQTWTDGFYFGEYDAENTTNNATGDMQVSMLYDSVLGAGSVTVTASNENTASVAISTGVADFSNSTQSGSLRLYAPQVGLSDFTVDNLGFQAIPEPATLSLGLISLGFIACLHLRRRR
ncbi:MAG: PEP-CTERM sorting domain-containing protein [Puniceicoccales bacterium]